MKINKILPIIAICIIITILTGCSVPENISNNTPKASNAPNNPDPQSIKTTYIYANNRLIAKTITIGNDSHIEYMIRKWIQFSNSFYRLNIRRVAEFLFQSE